MHAYARIASLVMTVALSSASSVAQEREFRREDAASLSQATEIRFPLRRPFDASDPDMKQIVEAYLGQPRCVRAPGERCPEWRQRQKPLVDGGDRLARYLISQYESSVAEGYMDTQTILTMLARTGSSVGAAYLGDAVDVPRSEREFRFALFALKECRSDRAVDAAIGVLSRWPTDDVLPRILAVRVLHWNLEYGEMDRPDAVAALRRAERDAKTPERGVAGMALKRLEGTRGVRRDP